MFMFLQFSFVTAVTSLVVVKPQDGNEATDVDLSDYDMLDDCNFGPCEIVLKKICHRKKQHCNFRAIEPESSINITEFYRIKRKSERRQQRGKLQ